MYNTDMPSRAELPTSAQLLRSTLIAAGVATALLVTVVLPAEYGIDPTGVGRVLGLAEMGEIKTQLHAEADADRAKNLATQVNSLLRGGLKAYEVSASSDGKVVARGQVLVRATVADAALSKSTPGPLAKEWLTNFQRLFWREQINGKF